MTAKQHFDNARAPEGKFMLTSTEAPELIAEKRSGFGEGMYMRNLLVRRNIRAIPPLAHLAQTVPHTLPNTSTHNALDGLDSGRVSYNLAHL
jgi:hypothetical protein